MNRTLVGITIAFCAGICIANKISLPFFLVYFLALILVILCICSIRKKKIFHISLFLVSCLTGALILINSHLSPKSHIVKFIPPGDMRVCLEGKIISDPVMQPNKLSFILEAKKLETGEYRQGVCGKVLVKISKKKAEGLNFFYGDKLLLEGKLYQPYLRRKGTYVILSVRISDTIRKIKSRQGNPLVYFALKIRQRLKRIVNENLSILAAAIINAVLLGQRSGLPKEIMEVLANTGTVHIIAISGLHLGIVAFIVLIALKLIRIDKRLRYIVTIFILFFYCILTGSNLPVVRATIMATILLLGYGIRRQVNIYNSLCLALLIILLFSPGQLFGVSLQLSFTSIFFLIWLAPKISSLFPQHLKEKNYLRLLINLFCSSLAVWLGLLPIISYYFKIISPVTILANMIVVPYMTLFIASGFCFLLGGVIYPPLASIFSPVVEISVLFLWKFLSLLNRCPLSHIRLP